MSVTITNEMLAAYWQGMPSPYEIDMEDAEAARRHIAAILMAGERRDWQMGNAQ